MSGAQAFDITDRFIGSLVVIDAAIGAELDELAAILADAVRLSPEAARGEARSLLAALSIEAPPAIGAVGATRPVESSSLTDGQSVMALRLGKHRFE